MLKKLGFYSLMIIFAVIIGTPIWVILMK